MPIQHNKKAAMTCTGCVIRPQYNIIKHKNTYQSLQHNNKNSSGDEIANVNFYAVRPKANRIR